MGDLNFDNLLNTVKNGAGKARQGAEKLTRTVVQKTNSVVSGAKLSYAVSETQDKINEILLELGKILYEEYLETRDINEAVNERCTKIEMLEKEIDDLKTREAELKNAVRCPSCGELSPRSNTFCGACGAKLD